jgi:hypothetical protein
MFQEMQEQYAMRQYQEDVMLLKHALDCQLLARQMSNHLWEQIVEAHANHAMAMDSASTRQE